MSLVIVGLVLFLAGLLVLRLWYEWTNRRMLQFARNLPIVEPTLPLLGHLHLALPKIDDIISDVILNMMVKSSSSDAGAMCFWAGPVPFIVIQNPEDIHLLLNSTKALEKGKDYRLIKFAVGDGIFTSPVHLWSQQRRHLQPMFLARSFENAVPQMNEKARDITSEFERHVDGQPVDALTVTLAPLVALTGYFLFGPISYMDFDSKSKMVEDICLAVSRSFEIFSLRVVRIWLQWEALFQILYKKDLDKIKSLNQFSQAAVQDMQEQLNNEIQDQEFKIGAINSQVVLPEAFLHLIRSNPNIVDITIFENLINNLFGAGGHTVSIQLSSCFLALAQHPEIQEEVYHEIISVFGSTVDGDVSVGDVKKLPYLDRVLKESMRLFTLVPLISRMVTEDIKTSLGVIPRGTTLYLDIYGNHMNPNAFPSPEKFHPDRFLPENITKRSQLSFIPFSVGPKGCLGKEYSMVLMKIVLVHVLRRFKLSTNAKPQVEKFSYCSLAIRKGGYPIQIENRLS